MSERDPLIRHISDTARWAAVYRAQENERRDALFRDPFARRLAGERGEQIAASLLFHDRFRSLRRWPPRAAPAVRPADSRPVRCRRRHGP